MMHGQINIKLKFSQLWKFILPYSTPCIVVSCYRLYHKAGSNSLLRTVDNHLLHCMVPWRR